MAITNASDAPPPLAVEAMVNVFPLGVIVIFDPATKFIAPVAPFMLNTPVFVIVTFPV